MSTLIIEHFKASELPQQWAQRLKVRPDQTVTVRIETEATEATHTPESFVTDDPAFGMWREREDDALGTRHSRGELVAHAADDDDDDGEDKNGFVDGGAGRGCVEM